MRSREGRFVGHFINTYLADFFLTVDDIEIANYADDSASYVLL